MRLNQILRMDVCRRRVQGNLAPGDKLFQTLGDILSMGNFKRLSFLVGYIGVRPGHAEQVSQWQ